MMMMDQMDLFSDDDEEIIEYLETDFFNRIVEDRRHHFYTCRSKDFLRKFRLSKEMASILLDKIIDNLEYAHNRNEAVLPMDQLLCTLRFYATGGQLITCGDFVGIHESTACRIVHKVTDAIARLYPEYICMPRNEEEQRITAVDFYKIAQFPRVLGAIDCTHVRIKSPGGDQAELYRNRKGYFSLNVQAICSSKLYFQDVVARWYGSAHDSNIWDSCNQKRNFLQGTYNNYLLVGDSGYAPTSFMMTPLTTVHTPAESRYNEAQIRTHNVIEQAFGVWKRRFPILSRGLQVHLSRIPGIIIATCVLHNMALMLNEPEPPLDPEYPPVLDDVGTPTLNHSDFTTGSHERQVLIEQHFSQI